MNEVSPKEHGKGLYKEFYDEEKGTKVDEALKDGLRSGNRRREETYLCQDCIY